MRITFIQIGHITWPIGGVKMVYEYANRLAACGHEIVVVHPRRIEPSDDCVDRLKGRMWPYRIRHRFKPLVPWFAVHPRVRLVVVPDLRERFIPDAEIVFATAWFTAEPVNNYGPSKGRKFYLIQHYETWDGEEERLRRTWCFPMHKVVVSKWLREIAISLGQGTRCTYIPNGIDFTAFGVDRDIVSRRPKIAMLYHGARWDWKGTADGVQALQLTKQRFPKLEAVFFSTQPRGTDVPDWVEFKQMPRPSDLRAIYNGASAFLHPSWSEGWGLPPAEAAACGCAVVAASNQGVCDYLTDGETALMAPVKAPAALAERLCTMLSDDSLRVRLAVSANELIRKYTWERAVQAMEQVLKRGSEFAMSSPRSGTIY